MSNYSKPSPLWRRAFLGLLLVMLGVVPLLGTPMMARAQTTPSAQTTTDPYAGLISPDFDTIVSAVGDIALTGGPRARIMLERARQ